jgi:hypothetical protein
MYEVLLRIARKYKCLHSYKKKHNIPTNIAEDDLYNVVCTVLNILEKGVK